MRISTGTRIYRNKLDIQALVFQVGEKRKMEESSDSPSPKKRKTEFDGRSLSLDHKEYSSAYTHLHTLIENTKGIICRHDLLQQLTNQGIAYNRTLKGASFLVPCQYLDIEEAVLVVPSDQSSQWYIELKERTPAFKVIKPPHEQGKYASL